MGGRTFDVCLDSNQLDGDIAKSTPEGKFLSCIVWDTQTQTDSVIYFDLFVPMFPSRNSERVSPKARLLRLSPSYRKAGLVCLPPVKTIDLPSSNNVPSFTAASERFDHREIQYATKVGVSIPTCRVAVLCLNQILKLPTACGREVEGGEL